MTALYYKTKNFNLKIKKVALLTLFISMLFISADIRRYANDGLSLCFNVIIGSVFPFMIATDLILPFLYKSDFEILKKLFKNLFKINGAALNAFLCAILCGFPLGARLGDELYAKGILTRNEFERFIGISSVASPAFVISGIGAAMRGNLLEGILLYFSSVISTVIIGVLFSVRSSPSHDSSAEAPPTTDFTNSVKRAVVATINICGFVTVFSVLCGILHSLTIPSVLKYAVLPFLEISNASKALSESSLNPSTSLSLTAFAITFSGFSAHMQVKSFITSREISMKKYYLMKLSSGALSASLLFIYGKLK